MSRAENDKKIVNPKSLADLTSKQTIFKQARTITQILNDINGIKKTDEYDAFEVLRDIEKILNIKPLLLFSLYVDQFSNNEYIMKLLIDIKRKTLNRILAMNLTIENKDDFNILLRNALFNINNAISGMRIIEVSEDELKNMTLSQVINKNRNDIYVRTINDFNKLIDEFYMIVNVDEIKEKKAIEICNLIIHSTVIEYKLKEWKIVVLCLSKYMRKEQRDRFNNIYLSMMSVDIQNDEISRECYDGINLKAADIKFAKAIGKPLAKTVLINNRSKTSGNSSSSTFINPEEKLKKTGSYELNLTAIDYSPIIKDSYYNRYQISNWIKQTECVSLAGLSPIEKKK